LKPMIRAAITDCHKYWCLEGFEQMIVLESIANLTVTRAGLRLLGFQRWKNTITWLTRKKTWRAAAVSPAEFAARVARLEEAVASRLPFRTNCLVRSLGLLWMLGERGIKAELKIGARKDSDHFEAHAWVEFEGLVLNDAGETHLHFIPFQEAVTSLET